MVEVFAVFEWFEMVLGVRSGLNMWFETFTKLHYPIYLS